MTEYRYHQVDVFADRPLTGNPLAVVHDAALLSTVQMQELTRWTNLSEAAFLLSPTHPDADYRVRIFEPKVELPFAGHPTLGSCAAWLGAGGVAKRGDTIVQECDAGLIEIRRNGANRLAFAAPPMIRYEPVSAADLAHALDVLSIRDESVIDAQWIDNGPGWMGIQLDSGQTVRGLALPTARSDHFDVGVVGLNEPGTECAIDVRAFFNDPNASIREDPVTGSLNASVAQWLLGNEALSAPYVAGQGTGRVHVDKAADAIWVGGAVDVRVTGTIEL